MWHRALFIGGGGENPLRSPVNRSCRNHNRLDSEIPSNNTKDRRTLHSSQSRFYPPLQEMSQQVRPAIGATLVPRVANPNAS